ncbi:MAG: phosphatidate cytidylyltransferase [Chloroflexota bacterium]|nr:phosphatidate cytidylyltransferase [Chloroflexota bacterium]
MLRARIISALVLVPVVLIGLFLSPVTTALLTGIAAIIGTSEFYTMAVKSRYNFRPLPIPGCILAASFSLAGYFQRLDLMFLAIGLFALIILLISYNREPSLKAGKYEFTSNWALTVFAPVYAGLPLGLITFIRTHFDGHATAYWWILLALLVTWGADTGAYFVGRNFGRHKLAPKISPNKTVEGALGGIVIGTLIVALIGGLGLNIELYWTIPLGIGLTIGSILGDLFESWVKRRFDIKDSGKLIPGHGGLLDRIDSFLVVAVLVDLFIAAYR